MLLLYRKYHINTKGLILVKNDKTKVNLRNLIYHVWLFLAFLDKNYRIKSYFNIQCSHSFCICYKVLRLSNL